MQAPSVQKPGTIKNFNTIIIMRPLQRMSIASINQERHYDRFFLESTGNEIQLCQPKEVISL